MAAFVPLSAQTQTVRTISAAGVTSADGNLSAIIGIPFAGRAALGNYEVSSGVEQAQIVYDSAYAVISYNESYVEDDPATNGNNFNLGPQTESHVEEIYFLNGGRYNYDSVRKLFLIVCPEKVADALNSAIEYNTVAVSGYCWTKQNLRSPVSDAMSYTCALYPTVPESYGLLYTWSTALNNTSVDNDGYVQGICPSDKWHLPNAEEVNALISNPIVAIRSEDDWFGEEINTNATNFTAYPAGCYNAATSRFEGLHTQTDWWTMVDPGSGGGTLHKTSLELPCHCYSYMLITRDPGDALSVRCVMKNEWPE